MMIHSDLTEEQLITLCSHITLTMPQTIADNSWIFYQYNAPMPMVYQAFIIEFTKPYVADINYRQGLHVVCSEIYQSQQN
jgi:hypothetical protein